jgi:glycosyltransferase involved in cell wall biosynthesis
VNPIRLVQVIPSLRCGGAERMVVNLMAHLDSRRIRSAAVVLGPREDGALEQALRDRGFDVRFLNKKAGFDPGVIVRLRKIVRCIRPDVVHSHLCLHYVLPALVGLPAVRQLTTVHLPGDTRYSRVVHPLTRLAFRCGVVPVAVSGEVAAWVRRVCDVADCRVIPNGIPVSEYRLPCGSRHAWRRAQGLDDADVVFVCVARLEPQKNHALLLDAFARALRHEPHAHLFLAGDGSCRPELELRVRELGLTPQVRFLGQRADVSQVLGGADVFVLASRNEGNPLALMEAMAAGLPILATTVGGVPELVAEGESGLLVAAGDCGSLSARLATLFRNAALRRALGSRAAARARHAFDASQMAAAYADAYERIA